MTEGAAAVVLGPGIGREDGTRDLVRELAQRIEAPLVIDADGLNAHAGRIEKLHDRGHPTVLTPHEGELGRLLEVDSDADQGEAARLAPREAARASGAIVVLKGDDTIVTDGDRVAVNRGGSPALATAGTGDVLSGMTGADPRAGSGPLRGRLRRGARPHPRRAGRPPSASAPRSR